MAHKTTHPIIALTMGDPRGIGAEIIVKALSEATIGRRAGWRVYGQATLLEQAAEQAGVEIPWWVTPVERAAEMRPVRGQVQVVECGQAGSKQPGAGVTDRWAGRASLDFLSAGIDACLAPKASVDRADALVTGPICKSAWQAAGLRRFTGHTELLAARTKTKQFAMMFVAPQLRVVLATTHIPLMNLRNVLTIGRVFEPINLAHEACERDLGIARPRIAVCGVNPHAGEGGMFGDEETRLIAPAIAQAAEHGISVSGPYPADTIFNAAVSGKFDCVVAMYHDQGLIPVKLISRDTAVNFTIGLPIIRTSPDHGTAFDIAGKNKADPGSMIAAMQLAADLVQRRRGLNETESRDAVDEESSNGADAGPDGREALDCAGRRSGKNLVKPTVAPRLSSR